MKARVGDLVLCRMGISDEYYLGVVSEKLDTNPKHYEDSWDRPMYEFEFYDIDCKFTESEDHNMHIWTNNDEIVKVLVRGYCKEAK